MKTMKKLWNPPAQQHRPAPSDLLSATLFLIFAFIITLSLEAMAASANPEDSLVVIFNDLSSTGFCLGVVTGEKEITTTALCAKNGGFGNYSIFISPEDLSYWEYFTQPYWHSERNKQDPIKENQIVTITLEQRPENTNIAKVSRQATPIKATPLWRCLAMNGDWNDAQWKWQMYRVRPLNLSTAVYTAPPKQLPESLKVWYFDNTVAIFDRDGALIGFSYCPEAAFTAPSDEFRIYSVDYQSGEYINHQEF